jgi:hypothetical protein
MRALDFPFVGLLPWLLLHAVAVDFFWVASSFGDATWFSSKAKTVAGDVLRLQNAGGLVGHLG